MRLREADREGFSDRVTSEQKKRAKLPDRCMEEEHPGRGSRLYEGHEVETYLVFSVKSEETKVN